MNSLASFFMDEIHRPFLFEGERTAAALIHGFPGTPAEIRDLAGRLSQEGWTMKGVLLPGFGPEIDCLFDRRRNEWVEAVSDAIEGLRKNHERVYLVGYSFGAAVSLLAAQQADLDGLILAAPFWRIGSGRERWIWRLLRPLFPSFKPFRRINFDHPGITSGMSRMLPGIDLTQKEVQDSLRNLRVPAQIFEEVMHLGASAKIASEELQMPVLVIQGTQDPVISPAWTRELHEGIGQTSRYLEVEAGHELLSPDSPSFEEILSVIKQFIRENGEPPND